MRDSLVKFERLYASSDDPWEYRTSSYELEKYEATLAAIPQERGGRALEVGCSIGIFTETLARRCDSVVGIDLSPRAIALAGRNLSGVNNVELLAASFPREVPNERWDVIVCSEVLYYLDQQQFVDATEWLARQLDLGACVVVVSWRGRDKEEQLQGDEVHDKLAVVFADFHTLDARQQQYRLDRFEKLR